MSAWTDFRNSMESLFSPEIQEAINFAETVSADVKAGGFGALETAFIAGYTTYTSSPATTTQGKLINAFEALLSSLFGYAVTIAKSAATGA